MLIEKHGAMAQIYAGRLVKEATNEKCAEYKHDFPENSLVRQCDFLYAPFVVLIFLGTEVVNGFSAYSLENAVEEAEPCLRQAKLGQTMSLDDKIARIHAVESGALNKNGRQFLRRKSKNWNLGDGTSIFIREKDLLPGITFPLLLAAYHWKNNNVYDLSVFAERPDERARKRATEAMKLYDQIAASGVDLLIRQANYWLNCIPGAKEAMDQLRKENGKL